VIAEPSFERWPISPGDREAVVSTLLGIVENGSPQHQIRAAKTLIEMDQLNRTNEVTIDFDRIRQILAERAEEEN